MLPAAGHPAPPVESTLTRPSPQPPRTVLTDLQKRKLTRYFRVYDVDDDGRIGPADFERVLENLRMLHGLDEGSGSFGDLRDGYVRRWEEVRQAADADHDGGVDVSEWLAYWEGVLSDDARFEAEVATLDGRFFETFDTDEDGVIGPDEFCNFFSCYGMSAAMARRIFMDLDANGDGVVSHEELMDMVREFYRGDDPAAPANNLFGFLD